MDDRARGMGPLSVEPGAIGPGPWRWIVTWGVMMRSNWVTEVVEAYDADEAMVIARERRPDLPTPRTAFLARQDL